MNRFGRLLALVSLLSVGGCVQKPLKPAVSSPSYFTDARQCQQASQKTVKARINPAGARGGVAEIPIDLGADPHQYRVCMENRGWATDPAKDPYLVANATCRKSAERPATATQLDEGESLKINGAIDQEAYDGCIRDWGREERVIVHPIKPLLPP